MAADLPYEVNAGRPLLGMSAKAFLRDYWQKRPLLIRGAFPAWKQPLSPEDLAGLACEPMALARLVRQDRQRDRWEVRQGPFEESDFPGLPRQDWTLLVQDVDRWDPDVRALLQPFGFLPRWRIDDVMVSFAAPGGSVGAHVDQYDVFLIQGEGRRRWQISTDPAAPLDCRDDVELKLLRQFSATHDWVLGPGDMLYLPPGVPHFGVAVDACTTFSVGMRAPADNELLADLADYLGERLADTQRYADPDLQPARDNGEIDGAALRRVRERIQALLQLDDAVIADWFGRLSTRYRSAGELAAPPKPPTRATFERQLGEGASLHAHPFTRLAWVRRGRRARLFALGDAFDCSVAAARQLCSGQAITAADFAALDPSDRDAVFALSSQGHLALSRPSRRRRS